MRRPSSRLLLIVLCILLLQQEVVSFMAPKQCRFMLNTNPAMKVGAAPSLTTTSSTITITKSSSSSSTARYGRWDRDGDLQGTDKIKACVPYILPILDGDHFGPCFLILLVTLFIPLSICERIALSISTTCQLSKVSFNKVYLSL